MVIPIWNKLKPPKYNIIGKNTQKMLPIPKKKITNKGRVETFLNKVYYIMDKFEGTWQLETNDNLDEF